MHDELKAEFQRGHLVDLICLRYPVQLIRKQLIEGGIAEHAAVCGPQAEFCHDAGGGPLRFAGRSCHHPERRVVGPYGLVCIGVLWTAPCASVAARSQRTHGTSSRAIDDPGGGGRTPPGAACRLQQLTVPHLHGLTPEIRMRGRSRFWHGGMEGRTRQLGKGTTPEACAYPSVQQPKQATNMGL